MHYLLLLFNGFVGHTQSMGAAFKPNLQSKIYVMKHYLDCRPLRGREFEKWRAT